MRKYKFTVETKEIRLSGKDVVLHRICAVADFGTVKIGDLGGWIEKEENLSHEGRAWVDENAKVYENAEVYGNARVRGDAEIYGKAEVRGNAEVFKDADVSSTSQILTVGPVGSRDDFTTFYNDQDGEITVRCGCFFGKIDEFLKKVSQTHDNNKHAQVYRAAAEVARLQIDTGLKKAGEDPKKEDRPERG